MDPIWSLSLSLSLFCKCNLICILIFILIHSNYAYLHEPFLLSLSLSLYLSLCVSLSLFQAVNIKNFSQIYKRLWLSKNLYVYIEWFTTNTVSTASSNTNLYGVINSHGVEKWTCIGSHELAKMVITIEISFTCCSPFSYMSVFHNIQDLNK